MNPSPDEEVRHVVVEGRVQGVGFRWFARERARRRGLRGWVQNRTDGSVEVHVSGQAAVLDEFMTDLRRGPNGAHVTDVREVHRSLPATDADVMPFPFQIQRQSLA